MLLVVFVVTLRDRRKTPYIVLTRYQVSNIEILSVCEIVVLFIVCIDPFFSLIGMVWISLFSFAIGIVSTSILVRYPTLITSGTSGRENVRRCEVGKHHSYLRIHALMVLTFSSCTSGRKSKNLSYVVIRTVMVILFSSIVIPLDGNVWTVHTSESIP